MMCPHVIQQKLNGGVLRHLHFKLHIPKVIFENAHGLYVDFKSGHPTMQIWFEKPFTHGSFMSYSVLKSWDCFHFFSAIEGYFRSSE